VKTEAALSLIANVQSSNVSNKFVVVERRDRSHVGVLTVQCVHARKRLVMGFLPKF